MTNEPQDDGSIVPPQNIAAERAVIGSLMLHRDAIEDCADLNSADFYRPNHEIIHAAISAIADRGEVADAITVADYLTHTGDLERVGGSAYLHECISSVATWANAGYHADIVAARATVRRVIEAGRRIVNVGQSATDDSDSLAVVDSAREILDTLAVRDDSAPVPNARAVYEAIEALDSPPGIPTPWRELTEAISGWKPGEVYVVGARPGVGKTIVGVNSALDVAQQGHTAVILSMEMSRVELYHRMLSQVGRVPGNRIQNRTLEDAHYAKLQHAASLIEPLPLVVDDRSHLTVSQARSAVRKATRKGNVGLVVVDYVGLMASTGKHGNREQEVASFSRGLKVMAKDLGVPVLLLAQVNRGPEQRIDKAPQLSDLRESGQLEADAGVAIMLHRDTSSPETASEITFHIRKNRHGPMATITLPFAGHYSTIYDNPGAA